jgi:ADP-heptose:LPS heptosyltransferase
VRLDQLGDVAASMAGMRRLRQLFQDARFEALVTPANEVLIRSTRLFDEITCVEFPYDHATRRRHLALVDEVALRKRYEGRPIDLAIDLSPGADSRPVLKLIKATYRAGFKPREFDFLDFGIDVMTRDSVNRRENISHTAMINALVETIGAAAAPPPERFPPPDGSHACLARYGLEPRRYVAIHSGARLEMKRWPTESYVELARLIRQETSLPVAFIADSPLPLELGESLRRDEGVVIFEGRMDFEVLDAVVSHARVFVGNDTGPKHLAAVRGVFTVSVHMGQVNWNEWGQDGEGCIVSRRAPCCGCGIEDVSECGKALACLVQIRPRAVADAVLGAIR